MDKSLIINKIKFHLGIKTDSDFAKFLGVKQPTISAWRTRDTMDYDLIITKCNNIDANWLLTGKGSMLKDEKESLYSQKEDILHVNEDAPTYKKNTKTCEELREEVDQLKDDKVILMQQNSALKDDKIELIQKNAELKVENITLKQKLKELETLKKTIPSQ